MFCNDVLRRHWLGGLGQAFTRARRAFTLVEIMIVVVIVALLATAATVNVRKYLTKAHVNTAISDISTIKGALDQYWAEHKRYPTNEEGLQVLLQKKAAGDEPYLNTDLKDPWGNPYQYNSSGPNQCEVISLGPDGIPGTDDISSEDLKK